MLCQQSAQVATAGSGAQNHDARAWSPIGLGIYLYDKPDKRDKAWRPQPSAGDDAVLRSRISWWPQATIMYDQEIAKRSSLPTIRARKAYNVVAEMGAVSKSTGGAGNEFEISLVSNVPLKLRTCGERWALQRVDASQPKPLPLDKSPGNLPVLLEPVQDETYVQCRLLPVQGDELPWTSAASSGGNAQASRLSDAQLAWLNFDSSYHALLKAEHRAHPLPLVPPT